jgi:hypothetical protein
VKKITYGGLVSALVILLLYIGNFTKSKIFFAALSSVFTGVLVELFGVGSVPIIIATNVLVFFLVPNPGYASLFFVLSFYGFLRKKPILIRFLYLNASTLLLVFLALKFFNAELPDVSLFLYILGLLGVQVAFFVYDYLYNRILQELLRIIRGKN